MPMEFFEGWEGSLLYTVEVTPGTIVTPATAFGYVKNVQLSDSANLSEEGAVGTPYPISIEEGVQEVGVNLDVLPTTAAALLLGKRNGSGKLSSYSIFAGAGSAGVVASGSKVNQIRGQVDAGGRLRMSMEFVSLAAVDNANIAPVLPVAEVFAWYELAHSLSGECLGIEWTISHNVQRRAVIRGSGTVMPVQITAGPPATFMNRSAYRIKEGRQSVRMTMRFIDRPSQTVIQDLITNLATVTLTFTGTASGTLTWTFSNGKPGRRENNFAEASEASWPLEMVYKDWNVV